MSSEDYLPIDIRISNLISSLKEVGIDLKDANIQKEIQRVILDILTSSKVVVDTSDTTNYITIVARAEQLGYKFKNEKHKEMLESFAGKLFWEGNINLKWKRPEDNSPIPIWLVTLELDKAIHKFFTTNEDE